MAYGLINSDTMADSSGGVMSPISSVMRNRIINGSMTIDQRNAGGSVSNVVGGVYTLDRWQAAGYQANKFTAQQSTTAPVGFVNSLKITSSSAYTVGASEYFVLNQAIEGFNIADLSWGTANAKTVTLSFQVYSSLTGTFGGSLQNSGSARSYPFSYSIPVANTWTTISITIAGDTSGTWLTTNGIGINVIFSLGAGSTFSGTAGSWAGADYRSATGATSVVGTNGATFYITGVQLEKGSSATGFEYRQYQQELALCQRYYVNMNGGTNTYQPLFFGTLYNTTSGTYMMNLPVPMRTIPAITSSGTIYAQNLSINISSLAGPYSQVGSLLEGDFTLASSSTSGNFIIARWNNVAAGSRSFNISAEL